MEPNKVEQLENWPEPHDVAGVNSFLAFVNYLREHMRPDWPVHEAALKPFGKIGRDLGASG